LTTDACDIAVTNQRHPARASGNEPRQRNTRGSGLLVVVVAPATGATETAVAAEEWLVERADEPQPFGTAELDRASIVRIEERSAAALETFADAGELRLVELTRVTTRAERRQPGREREYGDGSERGTALTWAARGATLGEKCHASTPANPVPHA
jgi:hypothetical protein